MTALLTTANVAEKLSVSEDWVRDHAGELGGIKLSDARQGPLRFEPDRVSAYLDARRLQTPPQTVSKRPGPRRKVEHGVPLLETREGLL